jgi:hypothetical protein
MEEHRHRKGDQPEIREESSPAAQTRIDEHVKNDAMRWKMLVWVVIAEFVLIACLSVGFLTLLEKANQNHAKIERNRDAVTTELEHTAFRQCARINNDRAVAHFYITRMDKTAERRLQLRLPILDCTPNLTGLPAHSLTSQAQSAFVHRWATGDLTSAERGICPDPPDQSIC